MIRRYRPAVASALLLLGIWQGLVWYGDMPPFILPGPWRVAEALWDNAALIAGHALITMIEVLVGLGLGGVLGAATALGLAVSPMARALVRPALVMTQALPVFALAPILTLWLGYGLWSKVLMAVLIIYFPVTSAFFDGLMRTPAGWLDLSRTMGHRRGRSCGMCGCLLRCRIWPAGCVWRRSMRPSAQSSESGSGPARGSATLCFWPMVGPRST